MKNDFKLNIVLLINIMIILLMIVFFASSFIQCSKINVKFPKQKIEILLNLDNRIMFDKNIIDFESLKVQLLFIPKDTLIVLKGDNKVEFGKFIEILYLLKKLEFSNFSIITEIKR